MYLDELSSTVKLLHRTPMEEPSRSFALPYAPAQAPAYQPPRRLVPLRVLQMATATTAVVLAVLVTTDIAGTFGNGAALPTVEDTAQVEALKQVVVEREVVLEVEKETEVAIAAEAVMDDGETAVESAAAPPTDEPLPTPGPETERLDQETAPTAAFAPAETAEPTGKQTHEWVIPALALAVALLALVTAGWSWRVARRRSG